MTDIFKQFSFLLLAMSCSGWFVLSVGSTEDQSNFSASSKFGSDGQSSSSDNLPTIEIKATSNEKRIPQITRMTPTLSTSLFRTIKSHVGSVRPSAFAEGASMHSSKGDDNDFVMKSFVYSESSYFISLVSQKSSHHKDAASKTLHSAIEMSVSTPKLSLKSSPRQRIYSFQEILPTESCHKTEYPNTTRLINPCQPLFQKSTVEERLISRVPWLQSSIVAIKQFNVTSTTTTTTTPQQTSFMFATLFGVFGTLLVLGIAGMVVKSIHKKHKNRIKPFLRSEFTNA